ncbi:hypothetical protein ACQJBY_053620 [Aegilops geniculata]
MKSYSLQRRASPAEGVAPALQRSASARMAPSPSPLSVSSSSSQYQSARASTSTANAPAFARHKAPSINCMAATSTDTPPATPRGTKLQKPKSASYSSMFSPRKLMQRASRAFRGRSSRHKRNLAAAADVGEVDSPRSVASKGSDAESSVFSLDDQITDDVVDAGAASKQEEIVPEKIIHEANPPSPVIHQLAPVAEEQEEARNNSPKKEDAAAEKEKEEEEPKKEEEEEPKKEEELPKKEAPPAPEDTVAEVDKIAAAKKQQREDDIKAEVVRRFQDCRVRTSTGKRSFDAETPRRRESARSNEAVEEARIKLLELRQVNKVKALVGAFETVMDDNQSPVTARKSRLNPHA